jgi:hypothetical protein
MEQNLPGIGKDVGLQRENLRGEATPWNVMIRNVYQIVRKISPSIAARPGWKCGFLDSSASTSGASQPAYRKPQMTAAFARPENPVGDVWMENAAREVSPHGHVNHQRHYQRGKQPHKNLGKRVTRRDYP